MIKIRYKINFFVIHFLTTTMDKLLIATLQQLNFTKNQIHVYTTGLTLGPSDARTLAQETKLGRTLIYHIISELEELGLVNKILKPKKTFYSMENPKVLQKIIQNKQKELNKLEKNITHIKLPKTPTPQKLETRYYHGTLGVKNAAYDMLSRIETKNIRSIASQKKVLDFFTNSFLANWFSEIRTRKISSKSLWTAQYQADHTFNNQRNLRLLPNTISAPATIFIADESMAIFTLNKKNPHAIIIDNKEVAQTFSEIHEQLWEISKEV